MKKIWSKYNFAIISSIIGSIIGYFYWKYFGCENGCTIKSNPRLMILYGAALGFLGGDLIKDLLLKFKSRKNKVF